MNTQTLRDVAERISVIEIRCTKCDRHGRMKLSTLIERYGADFAVPDLRTTLNAGCAHANAMINQQCDLYFPQLMRGLSADDGGQDL
jgi:hypothetical protein